MFGIPFLVYKNRSLIWNCISEELCLKFILILQVFLLNFRFIDQMIYVKYIIFCNWREFIFKQLFNRISTFSLLAIAVGYDDRRMMLNGYFSYNRDNQRALPFNVHIKPLPHELTTFSGSSSEYISIFNLKYSPISKETFFRSWVFEIINENLLPKFIPISLVLLLVLLLHT